MIRLLSVSQLNGYLRELLESDDVLRDVWVAGEIFDFKQPASGHWYFKLKEGDAVVSAACWRTYVARIGERPRNGDAVLAHGHISLYEASGALQLYVDMLRPAGIGLLHARFEELKARLEAEGLFDLSRKRPLPPFPRRIGVATSASGAVIQDITNVLRRRFPLAEVLLAPCRVQGDGAPEEIVEALYALYEQNVDVIIVARGGGSAEDLWAFNEEIVARAAFASPVPLVSGVGHETDITIIDYVADVRAPTPSAAAELVSPRMDDLYAALSEQRDRLAGALDGMLVRAGEQLAHTRRHLVLHAPTNRIARSRQMIDDLLRRATSQVGHRVDLRRARLDGTEAKLAALNPLATLDRGYAVVRRAADGQVITAPQQVASGDTIEVTVQGGAFDARVS